MYPMSILQLVLRTAVFFCISERKEITNLHLGQLFLQIYRTIYFWSLWIFWGLLHELNVSCCTRKPKNTTLSSLGRTPVQLWQHLSIQSLNGRSYFLLREGTVGCKEIMVEEFRSVQHCPRGPRGKVYSCVKARSEIRALTNPMDQQTIQPVTWWTLRTHLEKFDSISSNLYTERNRLIQALMEPSYMRVGTTKNIKTHAFS